MFNTRTTVNAKFKALSKVQKLKLTKTLRLVYTTAVQGVNLRAQVYPKRRYSTVNLSDRERARCYFHVRTYSHLYEVPIFY